MTDYVVRIKQSLMPFMNNIFNYSMCNSNDVFGPLETLQSRKPLTYSGTSNKGV